VPINQTRKENARDFQKPGREKKKKKVKKNVSFSAAAAAARCMQQEQFFLLCHQDLRQLLLLLLLLLLEASPNINHSHLVLATRKHYSDGGLGEGAISYSSSAGQPSLPVLRRDI
jgi:hypothetical protein